MTTIGNYIKSKGNAVFPLTACYNANSMIDACDDSCD